MKHKWAPLVHGRTYEVDYRSNLLAVPDWFTPADLAWAQPFIQGTFDNFLVKGVPEPLHWSMFKNERYCVVGLTCLAHQVSEDNDRDLGNRVLPIFLGYISRELETPMLPYLEIGEKSSAEKEGGQFSELYRYVRQRWKEKRQSSPMYQVADTYDLDVAEYPIAETSLSEYRKDVHKLLNNLANRVMLLPIVAEGNTSSPARDKALWTAASYYPGPVSLCLRLSRQSTAIAGPFLNATAYDVTNFAIIDKPVKEVPVQANPSTEKRQTVPPEQQPAQKQQNRPGQGASNTGQQQGAFGDRQKRPGIRDKVARRLKEGFDFLVNGEYEDIGPYGQGEYNQASSPSHPASSQRKEDISGSADPERYNWSDQPPGQDMGTNTSTGQHDPRYSQPPARSSSDPAKNKIDDTRGGPQGGPQNRPVQPSTYKPKPATPVKRDWFGTGKDPADNTNKDNAQIPPTREKQTETANRDWFGALTPSTASGQPASKPAEDVQPALPEPSRPEDPSEQQDSN